MQRRWWRPRPSHTYCADISLVKIQTGTPFGPCYQDSSQELANDTGIPTPCIYSPHLTICTTGKHFPVHNLLFLPRTGVNHILPPIRTYPRDSDLALLPKPGEGIRNRHQSSASTNFHNPRTHDSKIHLQFPCAPRLVGQLTQGPVEGFPVNVAPRETPGQT